MTMVTLNKWSFRIYLLCIVVMIEGGRGVCGLFFAQREYQTSVITTHPVQRPLLTLHIFDNNLQSHTYDCNISDLRTPGSPESDSRGDLFKLVTEESLVQVLFNKPFNSQMNTDEKYIFTISVSCHKDRIPIPDQLHRSNSNNDKNLAQTNVTLTVYSEEKVRQKSPCQNSTDGIMDMCFAGFPDEVYIRENSTGFVAAQIQGSQLSGCQGTKRKYAVEGKDAFRPVKLTVDRLGQIIVNETLDYERTPTVHVVVTCHAGRTARKDVKVNVVNINDIPPRVVGSTKANLEEKNILRIKKGQELDGSGMTVMDDDGFEFMDDIHASILGDNLGQFEIERSVKKFGLKITYIEATLKWAGELVIPNVTYSFQVVFTDVGYARNFGERIVDKRVFHVNVTLLLHRVVMDTAQRYSRVVGSLPAGTDFKVLRVDGAPTSTLAITPQERILYVNDSHHLAAAAGRNLTVLLQYLAQDEDNLTDTSVHDGPRNLTTMAVTVKVQESNITPTSRADCALPCSYQRSEAACESACGPGTGALGGRCEWSSKCAVKEQLKNRMCTCSPDLSTCPDGKCDELEQMVPNLCPMDCKARGKLLTLYQKEGREDNGHCWCQENGCECQIMKDDSDMLVEVANKRKGILKATTPSCGWLCITLALGGSMVVLTLGLLGLVAYRRCRPRAAKATPEKPLNGSVASLSATPSDYVVEGGEQQRVVSSAVSQNSLDWTPRGIVIDQAWEFPRSNLKLEKTLGEGEFGRVVRAQALGISNTEGNTTVAIKMLKECATGSEFRDLISEFTLLKDVSHNNVIKLLGVCSTGGPFYLIVEYCEHGALRSFLRSCRLNESFYTYQGPGTQEEDGDQEVPENCVSANDLLSFAWQIAKGMQYLSTMKLVHRDLAARNVLLATGKVIKISDFGLSRDIYEEDTYMKRSKGRIPVKWMAPESLYEQLYTTKSDVWSYGITLWEVVTLGATPYPGLAPERLFYRLKSGYRMEKPTHCSDQLFRVMSWCWRTLPGDRPTFSQLVDTLEAMLKQRVEYLDLGGSIDRNPILDDDNMETEDVESDHEGGYGSISRLTEDDAYLNQVNHAPHDFDDVICDDCTMRMIKEGDVTTECTKLLGAENDSLNNNSSSNNRVSSRPLLYIQVEHDNSDDDSERAGPNNAQEV